jgi:chromosome segregation ATPase
MKTSAVLLSLLLLACCSRQPAVLPGHAAQGTPKATPPVAESASKVRASAAEIDRSAERVEVRASTISRETRSLRDALRSATAEADRLRKAEVRTREEMDRAWMELTDITRRSVLLEEEAAASVAELERQRELRRQATSVITQMEIDARNKDGEVELLRMQYADEKEKSRVVHEQLAKAVAEVVVWKGTADRMAGRLRLYDAGAIALASGLAIYGFIRWILPLILAALRKGATGV